MELYRVAWMSKLTRHMSSEQWTQSKELCEQIAQAMNENLSFIDHWVESYAEFLGCRLVKRKRRLK